MSFDPTSSSTSKSPIVTKILIDFSEYNKLVDLKKHLDNQEKKLANQLLIQNQGGGGDLTPTETKSEEEKEEIPVTNNEESDSGDSRIVSQVIKKLQSLFGLVLPSQTGAGFCVIKCVYQISLIQYCDIIIYS